MKVINQLTLNRKGILHYLGGCNVSQKSLKVEAGSGRGDSGGDTATGSGVQLLTAQKPIERPGWWKGKFALFWMPATGVGR